jgi:hypothetical protein
MRVVQATGTGFLGVVRHRVSGIVAGQRHRPRIATTT